MKGNLAGLMQQVTMTGKHAVRRVEIDPSLLNDQEMLEDIVAAAINDAVNRVATTMQERMSDMTSGIPLPPGMKLPF